MNGVVHDLRFTLRNMGRSPGLAAVIALSLALGIGANTAIFSVIRAVLMKGLPVPNPERLVLMHWYGDTWPDGLNQSGGGGPNNPAYKAASRSLAFPFFRALRDGQHELFSAVFAFAPLGIERQNTTVSADGAAERVDGEMVSGEYFQGLGVKPSAGRLISDVDERASAHVAVISYPYWNRRFGGALSVLGQSITVNHLPFTIVGVTSPRFFGVQPGRVPDIWVPMLDVPELNPWAYRPGDASLMNVRDYWWTYVMARLQNGVDEPLARTKVDALFRGFVADALPKADRAHLPHIGFESAALGLDTVREAYAEPLWLLMAMVGLVLLIACANVAVLLLARAMARRREFALRLALGASRTRVIRQLLTESLLMAAVGGALGIVCAGWTSRGLLLLVPPDRRPLLDAHVDGSTLVFTLAVSVVTAVLFGLAPALLGTRVDLLPAMKQSGSGALASDASRNTWSIAFVVAQMAMSLVLLVGAALFVRTLVNLQRQPLGVDDSRLLVFGIDASQNGYSRDRLASVYVKLIERLSAIPGVEAASASRLRLFAGWVSSSSIVVPGVERKASMNLWTNDVGPDFARTLGMHVIAGRDISWSDVEAKRRVAVVTEEMARYFFGDLNVIGRRYSRGTAFDPGAAYEIVGVVSDAKYNQVRGKFPRTAYIPFTAADGALHGLYFHVRTSDPLRLAESVRHVVQQYDSSLAIVDLDAMSNQIGDSLWQERLFARLASVFSALALTLACVGLYGTISYGVGRRRAEIAVRMALGAHHGQVLWMILRQAIGLAAAGVAIGIPVSVWTGRYVSSLLFDLTPRDPPTLALMAGLLVAIACLAGYLPARRAALVDPAVALKQE